MINGHYFSYTLYIIVYIIIYILHTFMYYFWDFQVFETFGYFLKRCQRICGLPYYVLYYIFYVIYFYILFFRYNIFFNALYTMFWTEYVSLEQVNYNCCITLLTLHNRRDYVTWRRLLFLGCIRSIAVISIDTIYYIPHA